MFQMYFVLATSAVILATLAIDKAIFQFGIIIASGKGPQLRPEARDVARKSPCVTQKAGRLDSRI